MSTPVGVQGTLLTLAPTGAESAKSDVPALPVTVEELVSTARDCRALGAAVLHLHVRGTDTRPTLDLPRVREVVAAVREATDLVVQLSTGGAVTDPAEARLAVLDAEPDAASLSMGTVNFGRDVFYNPWDLIVELHTQMQQRGIVPEYEVFDLGQLATLSRLLDRHGPPAGGHVHVDLVMGVPGGMPGTTAALAACLPFLPPGATFAATGVGRTSLPVMLAALSAGGHLRVGMEDTLTYAPGEPVRGNAQLVARAAGLARIAQRPPLTPSEARQLLGITRVPTPAEVSR
ncbi:MULTISPECIES: 3-keto-5-aminohexanoate cleavage protein [unclassified Modestobacter]|uniref:3-keto-5-aminohexanoate cleavage protein n=1 Tax=unclassified Modestobacter TaxID=2643866 RepID=UPI0022AB149A|nr:MULTISPECIES: 3-keto-5-aminohexanoate cleavage protein [unclassified Modestobacter]MCZ2823509.1 3-keto-5-aminohexanoate cleavage protein [Modestobacter sp. VKM Ac-2981]MCZ2851754.1 3-keto-5-aminohexanoate cleavage protein [Modestobacter sp. VKM Ac-2982]